jgi:hypothetical protein
MAIDCWSIRVYLGNNGQILEPKGNRQKVHGRLGFIRATSLPSNPGIQTLGRFFDVTGIPGIDLDTWTSPILQSLFSTRHGDHFRHERL